MVLPAGRDSEAWYEPTKDDVKWFQKHVKIPDDGIVGRQTCSALDKLRVDHEHERRHGQRLDLKVRVSDWLRIGGPWVYVPTRWERIVDA